jgi:hypothetical protein
MIVTPSAASKVTLWVARMSSSGAAVGPGAKADSTGVTLKCLLIGDGSFDGREVAVGAAVGAGAQASKMSKKDEIKHKVKRNLYMVTPQQKSGPLWISSHNIA